MSVDRGEGTENSEEKDQEQGQYGHRVIECDVWTYEMHCVLGFWHKLF